MSEELDLTKDPRFEDFKNGDIQMFDKSANIYVNFVRLDDIKSPYPLVTSGYEVNGSTRAYMLNGKFTTTSPRSLYFSEEIDIEN